MILEPLNHKNYFLYCAKHYDNPQCVDIEEFKEDLNRIKYIKKLITRYEQKGELREHLILNHVITLYNVFGPEHLPRILYLKMNKQISRILTDRQKRMWESRLRRLQSPLRGGGQRWGEGPGGRFRRGQQDNFRKGPGPFGPRRRPAGPNTPQDDPIRPIEEPPR